MANIKYGSKRVVERTTYATAGNIISSRIDEYIDRRLIGTNNLPACSAIIVPNHCCCIDGVALASSLYKKTGKITHFLVQREGVYDPNRDCEDYKEKIMAMLFKAIMWASGNIPVEIDSKSSKLNIARRIREYLEKTNDYIGIFAEGPSKELVLDESRRIKPIEEREYKDGAALFALRSKVPIVPIGLRMIREIEEVSGRYGFGNIKESFNFLYDFIGERRKNNADWRIPYCINIGKPIFPVSGECITELTERIRLAVVNLYKGAEERVN